MASPIKEYLAQTGRLPEDALLGYIAFTLGADGEHDRDKLLAEFAARGLDDKHVPPVSRAVDAFKKAITNHQEHLYPLSSTTEARILFREVDAPNPQEVSLRAIMREERNDARSLLSFNQVGEVKLFRGPRRKGTIDESGARFSWAMISDITPAEREHLAMLGAAVKADFERYRNSLEGTRIRSMILSFMRQEVEAVALKASVHFVPIAHAKKLHRFAEVLGTLEGCRMDLVPLVDLADARDQVLGALQADTEATLGDLMADLQKARAMRTTPKTYAALRARYDAIMARSHHYAELLETSAERTIGATDVVKQMLAQLSREFLLPREEA